jgi:hypothetical protein
MHTVTSFHAANVPPEQLAAILAEHWALERLRDVRREFLPQLGVLALSAVSLGAVGIFSAIACGGTLVVLLVATAWLCLLELHRERQFVRHLEDVHGCVTRVVRSRAAALSLDELDVRKS